MRTKVQFQVYVYENDEQKQAALNDPFAFLKFRDLIITNGCLKAQQIARQHQHAVILKQRFGALEWTEQISY